MFCKLNIKIAIAIFTIAVICNNAYANLWLIYDDKTKDVISLSNENDAVIQKGWTKIIIPGEFTDYPLQYHARYYKYIDGKFIVNVDKISNEYLAEQEAQKKAKENEMIEDKMRELAIKALKDEGKI